jgi:hypothetical protein
LLIFDGTSGIERIPEFEHGKNKMSENGRGDLNKRGFLAPGAEQKKLSYSPSFNLLNGAFPTKS